MPRGSKLPAGVFINHRFKFILNLSVVSDVISNRETRRRGELIASEQVPHSIKKSMTTL